MTFDLGLPNPRTKVDALHATTGSVRQNFNDSRLTGAVTQIGFSL
jgi:hypothetical protein